MKKIKMMREIKEKDNRSEITKKKNQSHRNLNKELSPEQVKSLLEAMNNQEKKFKIKNAEKIREPPLAEKLVKLIDEKN